MPVKMALPLWHGVVTNQGFKLKCFGCGKRMKADSADQAVAKWEAHECAGRA